MTTDNHTDRPITITISDRGTHIRWGTALAALILTAWCLPSPLELLSFWPW